MRNDPSKMQVEADDEMLPEYDLRGKKGVRHKYAAAIRQGYHVRVLNEDGTTSITLFPPPDASPAKTRRGRKRNGTAKKVRT